MHFLRSILLFFLILLGAVTINAQVFCPVNSGFELGNFINWSLYTGSCCPIVANTLSGALPNRHVITTGIAVDPYGGFPVVATGGGAFSMKLGNDNVNSQAEKARYYVHVPSGVNNYSLLYRYAVVFEDPGHLLSEQPRFEVRAYDSATNAVLPCAQFSYISSSSLPGFQTSTLDTMVKYKTWTTATLNLSGLSGQTVIVEFATGDCDLGAHFGYGYVDMSCGLFQISSTVCGSTTTTLNGPPGFQTYTWMDSSFSNVVGSGQTVTVNVPGTSTTFHLILTPYSGFGCPDTLTTTVTISNLQMNASGDTTVCPGSSVQLNTNTTGNFQPCTYTWMPTTGLSCSNCPNPVATVTSSTTYYVAVTDSNGCVKIDTINIVVPPPFVINTSAQNASCTNIPNGTATASVAGGGIYTYSWSTIPVQTTQTATNLAPGTYTVTVTSSMGCPQTATVTVGIDPLFGVSTTSTPPSCFNGTNGTGTATPSIPGVYTYSWSTIPVQTTQTATNLPAGTYTVTVTNSIGCSQTAIVTVVPATPLTANITTSPTTCNGAANGTAILVPLGGTGPYTINWNSNPPQTGTTAGNLTAGTYTATVTDAHGCTTTATATIGQPPALNAYISYTNSPQCIVIPGVATAGVTGGTPPYTYSWNTLPVQTTQTASGLANGTYIVTVTDAHGCTDTAMVSIYQSPTLLVSTNVTNISCNGLTNGTATVTANSGTPPYTFTWSNTQTNATISNLSAGTYTVTVTDNNGCSANTSVTITEPPVLNTNSTVQNVLCFGAQNGSASVTVTGGTQPYAYLWNTGGTQANPNNMDTGSYTVIVTDANGCTDTENVHITEPAELVVAATALNTCNDFANGSATAAVNGGTAPYNIIWNTNPPVSGTTLSGVNAGTYSFTVTDDNGCTANASVTIDNYPSPIVDAGPDQTYCYGKDTIVLTATGAATYQWTPAPYLACSNCASTIAYPGETTTFEVIGTDNNNCRDTDQVVVTVYREEPTSVGPEVHICIGDTAYLVATGGTNYQWLPATGIGTEDPSHFVVSPGTTTTYTVIITENICFSDTLTQTVTVTERPTIELGPDLDVLAGSTVLLHAEVTNAQTIEWDPATGLSCGDCFDPLAFVENTITYTATVYNNTCKAQDDITITVSCDGTHIFFANSFTPNKDGINDIFYPQTSGSAEIDVFRVYNRWGQLLHEAINFPSNDTRYGWNGTYKGDALSPDVYVYYLETKCPRGRRVFKKGDISLLK